jgi:hypothetical protein
MGLALGILVIPQGLGRVKVIPFAVRLAHSGS